MVNERVQELSATPRVRQRRAGALQHAAECPTALAHSQDAHLAVNGHSFDPRRSLAAAPTPGDIPQPIRCAAQESNSCRARARPTAWLEAAATVPPAGKADSTSRLARCRTLPRSSDAPQAQNHARLSAGFIAAVKRDGGVSSGAPHSGCCGGDCTLRRRAPPREVRSSASLRPSRANATTCCSGVFHLPWSCASGAATCVGGDGLLCEGGVLGCAQRQRYRSCFSATSDARLFGASYVNCTTRDCASGALGTTLR